MRGAPTKRELQAACADAIEQRNQLQLLLCAVVMRAGGQMDLGHALVASLMDGETMLDVEPVDGVGVRLTARREERTATEMDS